MSSTLIVILITVGAVALFVVGLSLTQMIKGHNIKSEIGENEHMQERGIKCVVQEAREADGLSGCDPSSAGCGASDCATCTVAPEADGNHPERG